MKVLNICADDWANYMLGISDAMTTAGIDCTHVKFNKHLFEYEKESPLVSGEQAIELIKQSDVINVFHSSIALKRMAEEHNPKAVKCIYHTGTPYRSNSGMMREAFQDWHKFTDQTEFIEIEPMIYQPCAIDTEYIRPLEKTKAVGHFPSNANVKGTEEIIQMMKELDIPFHYSTERLKHRESLIRMGQCQVYLELFKPELNGKKYGCFGVTAFEAASLGCVVVTQNLYRNVYDDAFGNSPFYIANTKTEFNEVMTMLSQPDTNIPLLGILARKKIEERHSYKATGNRLKEILNKL